MRPESNRSGISWHPRVALEDIRLGRSRCGGALGRGRIADRRWTTARKNLLWHSRVSRPPIFDPLLKNATLRPKEFLCASAMAGTATGTTTSLTNHLHQAMDSWRTSALGINPQSNTMASACLRFGLVLDRSGGLKKCSPFSTWTRWSFEPDATGKVGLVSMTRFVTSCISALPPLRTFAVCTTWSR